MRIFDYSKLVDRKWDKEIVNYIGLIHEYKGRQQLYLDQKPEELERLVEIAKRQSTESSNAIEGIVTTKSRINKLIADKTTPKNRDEKEILGYRNVLNIIHENFKYIPISSNYILQLHKELYTYSDVQYGGKYKDVPNKIVATYPDGRRECIFKPLEPYETPSAVERLCEEFNKSIQNYNIDPLIVIPIFLHDFLCIHPFNDGNGRMSRLLTTLLLYKSGYVVGKYVSIEKKIEFNKDEYYDALNQSSNGWLEEQQDETPFIKYLLGVILAAYRDFEERVNILGKKLSSFEMVERAISNIIGKFTKSDLMERCPIIGRSSIENALKKMVEAGKLERSGSGKSTFYFKKE